MLKQETIKTIIKENAKDNKFYQNLDKKIKKDNSLLRKLENLQTKDKPELEMTLEG